MVLSLLSRCGRNHSPPVKRVLVLHVYKLRLDEFAFFYSTQETLRLAKKWAEEQLQCSGDGLSVGHDVYKEDARFIRLLLKGQTLTNKSAEAVRLGRLQTDAQEALATPRSHAQAVGAAAKDSAFSSRMASRIEREMSPNRLGTVPPERPARQWAD